MTVTNDGLLEVKLKGDPNEKKKWKVSEAYMCITRNAVNNQPPTAPLDNRFVHVWVGERGEGEGGETYLVAKSATDWTKATLAFW